MFGLLKSRKEPAEQLPAVPARAPFPEDGLVYAIGDIHGCDGLLDRLMRLLEEDIARSAGLKPVIVFMGDYVDRGPGSRAVLDALCDREALPADAVFLRGNHEKVMLNFLYDAAVGRRWCDYGGIETLMSYAIPDLSSRLAANEWEEIRRDLLVRMPRRHIEFLENLRDSWSYGPYFFAHAGVNPDVPLEEQSEEDLLWIRDAFLGSDKHMPSIVVHGHTPAEQPFSDDRRIGVDTGAYLTNQLTAARLDSGGVTFVAT